MTVVTNFAGLRIVQSEHLVRETPIFPDKKRSKRRDRRTRARYGGLTRWSPYTMTMGDTIYMHPSIYRRLQA